MIGGFQPVLRMRITSALARRQNVANSWSASERYGGVARIYGGGGGGGVWGHAFPEQNIFLT